MTLVLKNVLRAVVEHLGRNIFNGWPRRLWESPASWKNNWLLTNARTNGVKMGWGIQTKHSVQVYKEPNQCFTSMYELLLIKNQPVISTHRYFWNQVVHCSNLQTTTTCHLWTPIHHKMMQHIYSTIHYIWKLEICSVERGICLTAKSTIKVTNNRW